MKRSTAEIADERAIVVAAIRAHYERLDALEIEMYASKRAEHTRKELEQTLPVDLHPLLLDVEFPVYGHLELLTCCICPAEGPDDGDSSDPDSPENTQWHFNAGFSGAYFSCSKPIYVGASCITRGNFADSAKDGVSVVELPPLVDRTTPARVLFDEAMRLNAADPARALAALCLAACRYTQRYDATHIRRAFPRAPRSTDEDAYG